MYGMWADVPEGQPYKREGMLEVLRVKPDGSFWINEDATAEQLRETVRVLVRMLHETRGR